MDHDYIDEHDVANRYVMRTLSAAQAAEYEAHFIDCDECLDRLDAIKGLRAGLTQVAAEEAARAPVVTPMSRSAAWRIRPVFAVAALVVAVVAATYLAIALSKAQRALEASRQAVADLQRGRDDAVAAVGTLRRRLDEAEQKLRTTGPAAPSDPAVSAIPVFSLMLVRGADAGPSGPSNRVSLSRAEPWFVLSLELPAASGLDSFRATLQRTSGTVVWTQDGLRPTSPDTLAIALSSSLLTPGDHVI